MPDGSLTHIERRLEEDRAELARSLDRLTHTLAPDQLKSRAAEAVDRYGSDLTGQLWTSVRQNPGGFALVGAGLALLLTGAGQRGDTDARRSTPVAQGLRPTAVAPQDAMDGFDARVRAADAAMRHAPQPPATEPPATQHPRAKQLRAALHDGLEKLPHGARERIIQARTAAIHAQAEIEKRAARAGRKANRAAQDHPVTVAAAAFGLGAAIAALLPSTDAEDELLGARRDALMDKARRVTQDELSRLRDASAQALHPQGERRRDGDIGVTS